MLDDKKSWLVLSHKTAVEQFVTVRDILKPVQAGCVKDKLGHCKVPAQESVLLQENNKKNAKLEEGHQSLNERLKKRAKQAG